MEIDKCNIKSLSIKGKRYREQRADRLDGGLWKEVGEGLGGGGWERWFCGKAVNLEKLVCDHWQSIWKENNNKLLHNPI